MTMGINYVAEQTLWNEFLNLPIGCTYLSRQIKDKGILGGVKAYLGGPSYEQNLNVPAVRDYIEKYSSSVMSEYTRLSYVYKGAVAEIMKTDTTYIKKDTFELSFTLNPFEEMVDTNEHN